jgi:hypothetical protein
MPESNAKHSTIHDLLGAALGLFALIMLVISPWQVDSKGPDPFYKGPLVFPILVLSMMVLASIPFWKRLLAPLRATDWHLDGYGIPWKTLRVLLLLVLYLAGLVLVGLEISTVAFLFVALWVVGERSAAKMVFIPLGVSAILYFFFKYLLDVWFPAPLLFEWF